MLLVKTQDGEPSALHNLEVSSHSLLKKVFIVLYLIKCMWLFKKEKLPKSISLITAATSIRYFGWGIVEALIPIFLFQFTHSYIETGLLAAIYSIILLITIPLAGRLADKISAKTILIIGILFYPFLALSYFLAGIMGIAFFIIIARILNGMGYSFDTVGRTTYFRKHSDHKKLSSIFGYFDTHTNFWWIVGVCCSLVLVQFVSISWLFLAIIPTSLITLFIFMHLRRDSKGELGDNIEEMNPEKAYIASFKEIKNWDKEIKLTAFVYLFFSLVCTIVSFFIPIYAYTQNATLPEVILITIVLTLPFLLSNILGKIADRKREVCLYTSLIILFIVLISLYFIKEYYLYLIAAFVIGIVFELVSLTNYELSTLLTKRNHYGKVSSLMSAINEFGTLIGSILFGILIGTLGISNTFLITAVTTLVLLLFVVFGRKYFFRKI